jgi:hypothetical protein
MTDRRVLLCSSLTFYASALRPHTVGGVFAVTICLTIPSLCFLSLVPFKEAPVKKVLAPFLCCFGLASTAAILWSLVALS